MKLYRSLAGTIRIAVTTAEPAQMLTAVNSAGIGLTDVCAKDDLTVVLTVYRVHYRQLAKLLERRGDTFRILKKQGLYWNAAALRRRPVLVVGLVVYLLLALYLPGRVLFVQVQGNQAVSSQAILEAAEQIGICFGASRRQVRSEQMKNALLSKMPQLQWAGVNTYGCVAVISVEERTQQVQVEESKGVSSIVARCDGVIQEMTVTKGNALCKVGQAVRQGQVLISGYTDCGITIRATAAQGEVYAQTRRELEAVTLSSGTQRGVAQRQEVRYRLIFGKKLIKLYKDSGISDTGCVKMYEEHYLTLPGGFQLPAALVVERCIYYEEKTVSQSDATAYDWLEREAADYLKTQMLAGQILDSTAAPVVFDGVVYLYGNYSCYEMIGQVYCEEIYTKDG